MKNSVLCYLERSSNKYKNKEAIIDERGSITFGEIREYAVKVANAIIEKSIGIQKPVLVFLPKGKESIATFMGIVYSRNFYVPTDVKYPKERIEMLLNVLKPELIITDLKSKEKLTYYGISDKNILLIENIENQVCKYTGEELCKKSMLSDLVYIIFTSGSTGIPKGVTISNLNILEYIDWATDTLGNDKNTIMGSLAPLYFDLSTHEIYTCLSKASTLVMIPEKFIPFPSATLKYIKEKHVNSLYWVPSAYANIAILDLLKSIQLDEVQTMIFGGEVMPVKFLNYWRKYLPNLKLIVNMYGPTEATVNCTYYIVDREFSENQQLPLGKSCDIKEVILLDEKDRKINPNEVDTIGEMCVCGTSLSKGYWNNKEATEKSFVQNPLNSSCQETMYRTGDLASYNERGELEFIGRKDFQIKHMGYRIELGEIEATILMTNIVENACVIYDKKERHIILVYCSQEELAETYLQCELSKVLPRYMIPSKYIYIKNMPITGSGKIDRKGLSDLYIKK